MPTDGLRLCLKFAARALQFSAFSQTCYGTEKCIKILCLAYARPCNTATISLVQASVIISYNLDTSKPWRASDVPRILFPVPYLASDPLSVRVTLSPASPSNTSSRPTGSSPPPPASLSASTRNSYCGYLKRGSHSLTFSTVMFMDAVSFWNWAQQSK